MGVLGVLVYLGSEISENVGASHFESEGVGDKAEQVEAEEGEHEQSDVFHPFEPLD